MGQGVLHTVIIRVIALDVLYIAACVYVYNMRDRGGYYKNEVLPFPPQRQKRYLGPNERHVF